MNGLQKSLSHFAPAATRSDPRAPATIFDWGLELRLWVATCVFGLASFSARSLGIPLDEMTWRALGVVFFSTLALYNLDGTLDAPERGTSSDPGAAARRRLLHLGVTALSVFALFTLAFRLSVRALVLTSLGAFACSLYALPLTLRRRSSGRARRTFRLKSLPYLKAPFVGCAVGIATVWVPIWAHGAPPSMAMALLLTIIASLYCTANALLFDIPDVGEDTRSFVPTLPARWGLSMTRRCARLLALTGVGASLVYVWHERAGAGGLGLVGLGAALLVFTELLHFRTSRRLVSWWVDGALLLPLSFQLLTGG